MIQQYTIYISMNIRTQITHITITMYTVCKIRSADRETLTPGTRGSGKRRVRTSKRDECGQKFYFPTHGRRRRVGVIGYGPGASGRPKSVSGRTAPRPVRQRRR